MTNTPLYRVDSGVDGIALALKLEGHNPTGSIKDRMVAHLLVEAAAEGLLGPGKAVVEVSSGSSGIALARAARLLDHPCEVLLPDTIEIDIVRRIEAQGGMPVLLPADLGPQYAFSVAQRRMEEGCYWPNQYANPRVPCAYVGLADELMRQMPTIDCFVAGVGTGGTLYGVGRALKRCIRNAHAISSTVPERARRQAGSPLHIVAVEPQANERLEGLRNTQQMRLENDIYPPDFAHETLRFSREEAQTGRRLLALQGVRCSASGGAVYLAALELARRGTYKSIVGICADGTNMQAEEKKA